jgi:hypothetical protein
MPAMTPKVLEQILGRIEGVERKDHGYAVGEDHHLSFYVGQPGQAMVVSDVIRCHLHEEHVELLTRETHTTVFVACEDIHAVTARPPKEDEQRRAGFS